MLITFQGDLPNINLPCFNIQLTDIQQFDRVSLLGTPLNEMPLTTRVVCIKWQSSQLPICDRLYREERGYCEATEVENGDKHRNSMVGNSFNHRMGHDGLIQLHSTLRKRWDY